MITNIKNNRLPIASTATVLCLLMFMGVSQAKEGGEQVVSAEIKQVQGQVSSLTPAKNPEYIGVDYQEDKETGVAYEIVLAIDKNIKLEHKRSLADIAVGDSVDVTYEEATVTTAEGQQQTRRTAKVISFVKPADTITRHKYGIFTEQETREMKEKNEGSLLPLKGIKE